MHKSRLAGFIIDCQTQDLDASARFWGAALGMRHEAGPEAAEALYRRLATAADDLAEARRLEALGARRVAAVGTWVVMEAPTGHRFCVVRVQRGDFAANANIWP
jgi:plasmid stabilization system protein ParE